MSADTLSLIAGTALSLIFSYVPGVHNWFELQSSTKKRMIMLGLLTLSAGAGYGISCLGWGAEWGIAITCDKAGALSLIEQLIMAIIANQSIYAISPK